MKKLRVLLVDDAADGMEALSQIDTLCPDIVIMDINIPIMSGLKVIQLSRIKHPQIAYVIVSGYDDFSYCQQALRLQITDYILKPVNYEEFGSCIDNLKISLFERRVAEEPAEAREERPITGITRYLQEVYLTNFRMEKAKKLLLSTPLSVAEVAERSGYGDYRVFTKVFKKSEGVTPSQYRRDFLESTGSGERR